jgi:ketosteroid isomerase-like protein
MMTADVETQREHVLAVISRERRAVESGSPGDYWSVLAEDAVFLPPGLPPKSGHELHAWLKDFVERFRVDWLAFSSADVVVVGDLAVHSYIYRWRVTPRSGGAATLSCGKGVHILRRSADGSWRIWRAIWNPSPVEEA